MLNKDENKQYGHGNASGAGVSLPSLGLILSGGYGSGDAAGEGDDENDGFGAGGASGWGGKFKKIYGDGMACGPGDGKGVGYAKTGYTTIVNYDLKFN